MSGLLLKDLYMMKNQGKVYLGILGFYTVFTLAGLFDFSFLAGFLVLITTMLPMSTFSYDDLARWPKYAAATPAGRRGIVQGKYLFVLCTLAASLAAIAIIDLLLCVLGRGGDLAEMITSGVVCAALGLGVDLILIPVLFKYGAEKGRYILMGVWLVVFLLFMGLISLLSERPGGLSGLGLPLWLGRSAPVIAAGLLAVGAVLSYSASLHIFGKKEL